MKHALAFILLAVMSARADAALEPASLAPDCPLPALPASLQMDAINSGSVELVVDIGADGTPTDWLVLAYTEPRLARACTDSLPSWRFRPARIDGVAVPSQSEFTVNFTVSGVVLTSNMGDEMLLRSIRDSDDHLTVLTCSPTKLDRAPVRTAGGSPTYAAQAALLGVQGKVTVHFYIDENGTVRMPSVDPDAHPYLAKQALDAILSWKFEPPTSRRQPVLIAAEEQFKFGPVQ
ncbi:MAG TPA: energy transducer TonB [Candidatus Didemnitutus sp.]|jgi:TonB family protein